MSVGVNKVMLLGYLTKDPEKKVTNSGLSITKTVFAINNQYKKDGQVVKEVEFIGVTWFGKTADLVYQYLKKGSLAMVQGKLKHEEWKDKNSGENRRKLEVYGEEVTFLDSKKEERKVDEEIPY